VLVRYTRWLTLSLIRQRVEGIKLDEGDFWQARDKGYKQFEQNMRAKSLGMCVYENIARAYQQKILEELK
jgi:hypothetical protein